MTEEETKLKMVHPCQQQINIIEPKDVLIKPSKLLCWNIILFYSKLFKLKAFPAVISRMFIFIMNGPSQKELYVRLSHFVINVAYFNHILVWSNCKELLLPLEEEEIR